MRGYIFDGKQGLIVIYIYFFVTVNCLNECAIRITVVFLLIYINCSDIYLLQRYLCLIKKIENKP